MTEPQLPPSAPHGSVPPVPPAPAPQTYQTPPGAYPAPVGGYAAPAGGYRVPEPAAASSPILGVIAFALSLAAAILAPLLAGIAGYGIGFGLPSIADDVDAATSDLSFLSPVRDQVLLGEIGFWIGTLTGIAAIVLGIIAIAKRRGRAWGIIALVLAVLGAVMFFVVLGIAVGIGAGSGAVSYYGS